MKVPINEFSISLIQKGKSVPVKSTECAAKLMRKCFNQNTFNWVEEFIIIALNAASKTVGMYRISSSCISSVSIDVRVVFQFALLSNATSIIVAHNHPSGSTKPSKIDISATDELIKAGNVLKIEVYDSFIITNTSWYSINQKFGKNF